MNQKRMFTIPAEYDGMTVKAYARQILKISGRALIKQKHQEDGITINGRHSRTIDILHTNDILSFQLPPETPDYTPIPLALEICYKDENFLVVNKPPAMPVHTSGGHQTDSLLNAVAYYDRQQGEAHIFRPLYRLDRDTSGVVWIARNRMAASGSTVRKTYYGICQGILKGQGRIDKPIGFKNGSKIVRQAGHGSRAVTNWRAMKHAGGYTLLAFQLETGRTHQIRVHLSDLGYPLAGDDLYGGNQTRIGRQALHCMETELSCKVFKLDMKQNASYPEDMLTAFPELLT